MPQGPEGPEGLTAPQVGSPHGQTEQLPVIEPPPPPPPPPAKPPATPPAAPQSPAQPRSHRPPMPPITVTGWVLGLISVAAVAVGLSITEDGRVFWDLVNAWGAVAIVGAVLSLAPAIAPLTRLHPHRAWQVAMCGAGALLLFWVLFVLPRVGSNVTLLLTVGVAAGMVAAWLAPGRENR